MCINNEMIQKMVEIIFFPCHSTETTMGQVANVYSAHKRQNHVHAT